MASNLSFGSGASVIFLSTGSPDRVSALSSRAPGSVSGRLSDTTAWRSRPSCPGFPSRFRCRHSLLGHPIPAEELGPPHGRLTGQDLLPGPRRGYRVPHARATTGVGAPFTPRTAVLIPDRVACPAGACRFPAASPYTPPPASIGEAPLHEASTRVQAIHPSGLPLACAPRMERATAWAFPRASHPADQEPTTHVEVGTGHRARTWNYTLNITSVDPPIGSSLITCDLASHRLKRSCGHGCCMDGRAGMPPVTGARVPVGETGRRVPPCLQRTLVHSNPPRRGRLGLREGTAIRGGRRVGSTDRSGFARSAQRLRVPSSIGRDGTAKRSGAESQPSSHASIRGCSHKYTVRVGWDRGAA